MPAGAPRRGAGDLVPAGGSPARAASGDRDEQLLARVRHRLAEQSGGGEPTVVDIASALRTEGGVSAAGLREVRALESELTGFGPLAGLIEDGSVTDVLVNGPHAVWVDRGQGLVRTEVGFDDEAAVRQVAVRLAGAAGRRLDAAQPWVDARLPAGVRLHAVLPPVSRGGTVLSLRVPRSRSVPLEALVGDAAAAWLRAAVCARLTVVVTGATGSGKTTLTGALVECVPPGERVVVVEDAAELAPDHPHVVSLEGRPANVEGAGAVSLRDLVRQALRMRPDRLVVGEVRGAEVVDLLTALTTGHAGSLTTVHASAASELPQRLRALGWLAGLPGEAVLDLMAVAVDIVVHLGRDRRGARGVQEIGVVAGHQVVPALQSVGDQLQPGPGLAALRARLVAAETAQPGEVVAAGTAPPGEVAFAGSAPPVEPVTEGAT